jgi:hypothetical protein
VSSRFASGAAENDLLAGDQVPAFREMGMPFWLEKAETQLTTLA